MRFNLGDAGDRMYAGVRTCWPRAAGDAASPACAASCTSRLPLLCAPCAQEGWFYVWSKLDVEELLGERKAGRALGGRLCEGLRAKGGAGRRLRQPLRA